jgi:hypothetical protein
MIPQELTHPGTDQLAAFVSGRLDEAESVLIERHVADCNACRLVLEALPDDSLDRVLRAPSAVPDSPPDSPKQISEKTAPEGPIPASPSPSGAGADSTCDDAAVTAPDGPNIPRELIDHPRYALLTLLGSGGMGAVYEAKHRLMDRMVALKVLGKNLVASSTAVERFRREVRAAAQLAHPNIVTAYDAEQAGSIHFLVMERVEGKSLAQLIKERGPLRVE